jgi:hypothetical protein
MRAGDGAHNLATYKTVCERRDYNFPTSDGRPKHGAPKTLLSYERVALSAVDLRLLEIECRRARLYIL